MDTLYFIHYMNEIKHWGGGLKRFFQNQDIMSTEHKSTILRSVEHARLQAGTTQLQEYTTQICEFLTKGDEKHLSKKWLSLNRSLDLAIEVLSMCAANMTDKE